MPRPRLETTTLSRVPTYDFALSSPVVFSAPFLSPIGIMTFSWTRGSASRATRRAPGFDERLRDAGESRERREKGRDSFVDRETINALFVCTVEFIQRFAELNFYVDRRLTLTPIESTLSVPAYRHLHPYHSALPPLAEGQLSNPLFTRIIDKRL